MTFTTREKEVLALMDQQKKNAEIAALLGMKPGTVKAHKKSIRIKQYHAASNAAPVPSHEHEALVLALDGVPETPPFMEEEDEELVDPGPRKAA